MARAREAHQQARDGSGAAIWKRPLSAQPPPPGPQQKAVAAGGRRTVGLEAKTAAAARRLPVSSGEVQAGVTPRRPSHLFSAPARPWPASWPSPRWRRRRIHSRAPVRPGTPAASRPRRTRPRARPSRARASMTSQRDDRGDCHRKSRLAAQEVNECLQRVDQAEDESWSF
jgi:hypothetical protein